MRAKPTPEQALNFIPARLGGTGAGFTQGRDKEASSAYCRSLSYGGSLSPTGVVYPSTTSPLAPQRAVKQSNAIDAETLRARARVVSLRLLSRLNHLRDSMDAKEITDALNAAGKLTGAQSSTQTVEHRHGLLDGQQRAERAAALIAKARHLLYEGGSPSTSADTVDAEIVPSDDETTG